MTPAGAPPVIVTAGRKLAVSVVTANAGFARTKVTRTAVYLSADEVKDDSDRKLDGASYVGELDPQEVDKSDDAPRTLRLGVAPVTRAGAYFLTACPRRRRSSSTHRAGPPRPRPTWGSTSPSRRARPSPRGAPARWR